MERIFNQILPIHSLIAALPFSNILDFDFVMTFNFPLRCALEDVYTLCVCMCVCARCFSVNKTDEKAGLFLYLLIFHWSADKSRFIIIIIIIIINPVGDT